MSTALDRPPEEAGEDTSFARGLRVFLTVVDRGEIRADELSVLLDTPLSTIYRYLRTLTEFGFVERHGGVYRLGARLHVIGAGLTITAEELIRAADPILAGLADTTGETVFISRRIGLGAMILAQYPSPRSLRVVLEAGHTGPLHIGAVALVLLAYAPTEVEEAALEGLRGADDVRRTLRSIVADGFARDDGETVEGATTLAVPVLLDEGIVAALGMSAPTGRAVRRWDARSRGALRRAAAAMEDSIRTEMGRR